ncbi:hypothetical protein PR002_g27084 [Phytophthora rubi]|uniref:Uncharacterized protein n=2 Tax=Phytophthora TaxID=4783 RepID=A0A6A3HNL7_9STRA|nr:hypothetical protein PR002_g27084 [Phytophthora rubi]
MQCVSLPNRLRLTKLEVQEPWVESPEAEHMRSEGVRARQTALHAKRAPSRERMLLEMSLVEAVLEFEGGVRWLAGEFAEFVNSVNQVFKDNIKTGEIESVNKPGMRIDDGGAVSAAINTTMSRL